jgi:hypothetical protein
MKKFKNILIILLLPIALFSFYTFLSKNKIADTVQAFGSLTATYLGVPLGSPIFNVNNMMPGGPVITRTVKVKNDGKNTTQVYVEGIRRGPDGQSDPKLETILDLQIIESGKVLYTGKLSKFFEDSKGIKTIRLDNIQKNQTKSFDFKVSFPSSAGNQFQNKSVLFNLSFSENGEKDPHDNRFDDKHPDEGRDDKGHNQPPKTTLTPKPTPTPSPRPTKSPSPRPTHSPSPKATPTPKHYDRDRDR